MLPISEKEKINALAKKYFADKLGLAADEVPDAAQNLLGVFEVLFRIDERLKKQQTL